MITGVFEHKPAHTEAELPDHPISYMRQTRFYQESRAKVAGFYPGAVDYVDIEFSDGTLLRVYADGRLERFGQLERPNV